MSASLATRFLSEHAFGSGAAVLTELTPLLQRIGVEFECGTEDAVAYLSFTGGDAVTHPFENGRASMMFLSESPSLSAVFEELAHVLQHRANSHGHEDVRFMRCKREIEAKECLVENKDKPPNPRLRNMS